MRMSAQDDHSRTPTRELRIVSFANFAHALSFPAPAIPKSGLKSLSIRTLHTLGGGRWQFKPRQLQRFFAASKNKVWKETK